MPEARERFQYSYWKVSRSGQIPEPTVIVRMKESKHRQAPSREGVSLRVRPKGSLKNGKTLKGLINDYCFPSFY